MPEINGAEALVGTLLTSGVDTCFANPGTSEMHFVAALDQAPAMRCVLGLFEGVVTGAADGYARMADKPAATLLHCGPGLANGLANLHNAKRARTPVVNIVGDQATYHAPLDPPLASDAEGLSRPVSRWVHTSTTAADVGPDAARAVAASLSGAGGVATLVLPSDACWNPGGMIAPRQAPTPKERVDDLAIDEAAHLLRSCAPVILMIGGQALRAPALEVAAQIAAATGARLMAPNTDKRITRGGNYPNVPRLPYFVEQASAVLGDAKSLILIGAADPVAFFAYPGKAQTPVADEMTVHRMAGVDADLADALDRLADRLGCGSTAVSSKPLTERIIGSGAISSAAVAASLNALLPEDAVVVDESITFGGHLYSGTSNAAPHDWLCLTGGAIGIGIPLSAGAAIGAPGRRVVTLQADGSAAYTLQGLWTQAREKLDVTTIIFSNRRYAILLLELENVGATAGKAAKEMMSLDDPALDWVSIARGFGVSAERADTMERFNDLLAQSFRTSGPSLIELTVA